TFSDAYFLEIEAARTEMYIKSDKMLSERLPRVMAWMDEIKTVCESNGIRLFVMVISDELQLDTELQQRVLEKRGTDKTSLILTYQTYASARSCAPGIFGILTSLNHSV